MTRRKRNGWRYRSDNSNRNFNDPAYKKWRLDVYRRDKFTCRWPNCGSKKQIRAHHIRTWAAHPHLRFVILNGITLCKIHHDLIHGNEDDYIRMFMELVRK